MDSPAHSFEVDLAAPVLVRREPAVGVDHPGAEVVEEDVVRGLDLGDVGFAVEGLDVLEAELLEIDLDGRRISSGRDGVELVAPRLIRGRGEFHDRAAAAEKDLSVVGEAENGALAVKQALKLKPDVVIMDLVMPQLDGVAATRELHEKLPETKVIVLTSYSTSDTIAGAIATGASGAVMKSADDNDLLAAIAIRKNLLKD